MRKRTFKNPIRIVSRVCDVMDSVADYGLRRCWWVTRCQNKLLHLLNGSVIGSNRIGLWIFVCFTPLAKKFLGTKIFAHSQNALPLYPIVLAPSVLLTFHRGPTFFSDFSLSNFDVQVSCVVFFLWKDVLLSNPASYSSPLEMNNWILSSKCLITCNSWSYCHQPVHGPVPGSLTSPPYFDPLPPCFCSPNLKRQILLTRCEGSHTSVVIRTKVNQS